MIRTKVDTSGFEHVEAIEKEATFPRHILTWLGFVEKERRRLEAINIDMDVAHEYELWPEYQKYRKKAIQSITSQYAPNNTRH